MADDSEFQITCRICNKPLKLGIDTAADEDGKAVHETCYTRRLKGEVVEDHQEWLELCQQASVEQDSEKLLQLVRRINELLEAKDKRLQPSSVKPVCKGNGIFQIAYDEMLLITRAALLKDRGYEINSALGNNAAQHVLANHGSYRLFIVGHAAPRETREEIIRWLKMNFPHTRILALNPPHQENLAEADFNLVLNGPEGWLSIVANVAR